MAMSERNFASKKIQNIGAWMEINRLPLIPDPRVDERKKELTTIPENKGKPLSKVALKASIDSANAGDPIDTKTYLKLVDESTAIKAHIAKVSHINEAKARRYLHDDFSHVFAALDEARPFQRLQGDESVDNTPIGDDLKIGVPSYLKDLVIDTPTSNNMIEADQANQDIPHATELQPAGD